MRSQIANMMQQAQRMQEDMKKAQEQLAGMEVVGQSGGGLVRVTMTGQHEVRRVEIDRNTFADDAEMAEDLVAAAINDAVNKVAAMTREHMSGLTAGMELPPGMKLPF